VGATLSAQRERGGGALAATGAAADGSADGLGASALARE